jgi:hypothetical protein
VIPGEDFLHRIQGAGADVAIDDAERRQSEYGQTFAGDLPGLIFTAVHKTPESLAAWAALITSVRQAASRLLATAML